MWYVESLLVVSATILIVTLLAGTHFSEIVEVAMCYLLCSS